MCSTKCTLQRIELLAAERCTRSSLLTLQRNARLRFRIARLRCAAWDFRKNTNDILTFIEWERNGDRQRHPTGTVQLLLSLYTFFTISRDTYGFNVSYLKWRDARRDKKGTNDKMVTFLAEKEWEESQYAEHFLLVLAVSAALKCIVDLCGNG